MVITDLRTLTGDLWGRTVEVARTAIDNAHSDPEAFAATIRGRVRSLSRPMESFDNAAPARERIREATAGTAPAIRADDRDWLTGADAVYGIAMEIAEGFNELESTIEHAAPYPSQLRARDAITARARHWAAVLQDLKTRSEGEWYAAARQSHATPPSADVAVVTPPVNPISPGEQAAALGLSIAPADKTKSLKTAGKIRDEAISKGIIKQWDDRGNKGTFVDAEEWREKVIPWHKGKEPAKQVEQKREAETIRSGKAAGGKIHGYDCNSCGHGWNGEPGQFECPKCGTGNITRRR